MVNNIDIIKPLLKFDSLEEFYFIQVLQRSKENPDLGKNNHLVKAYYVYSLEYLDKRFDEMKKLADTFNARIYIHLNRRNAKTISFEMMETLAHSMKSGQFYSLDNLYNSVCGKHASNRDKTWIIDIDWVDFEGNKAEVANVMSLVEELQKETGRTPMCEIIPTKNGVHLITHPFNSEKFGKVYPQLVLHKNNPTILYIP